MFVNFKSLCIHASLLISLILKCESRDLNLVEIGEVGKTKIATPQCARLEEPLISPEIEEEAGYVAANVCETIEGVCKSGALIGLANFAYPGNNTLELVTVSVNLASMLANAAKYTIRSHDFVTKKKEAESKKMLSLSNGAASALNVENKHSSVTSFKLHYLYFAERFWGETVSVLGYLEVLGQYTAPVLTSYALTLPDEDSHKKYLLNVGYVFSATTALCYFYSILAQNGFNKRHQERIDLAEQTAQAEQPSAV
ncbi:MAG: hypothetical protein V4482_01955 [Pseudomonadota bacterium]